MPLPIFRKIRQHFVLCVVAAMLALPSFQARAMADGNLFTQQVAPILERHCVRCHMGEKAKGGFSLTNANYFRHGGENGDAVLAGKPEESPLFQMISGPKPRMPKNAPPLSAQQVGVIRRWIAEGAPWPADKTLSPKKAADEKWWSLETLAAPQPPKLSDPWIRSPIDAFVAAKHKEFSLSHRGDADRRTLIRRVTFDLIGLPPTPEEVESFVVDSDTNAYEKLADRLLASPHYGEHWARHWLDVVHFGETHGFEKDKVRPNAWRYRDYVIQSLNADKPFGKFVQEQLAGDYLWPNDPQAVTAAGFLAAGPWDFVGHVELAEGTIEKQNTRIIDRDDMVATTMTTFASTTVHCARCHDHPFDPISQTEYYRLQAVFAGIDRRDRPLPLSPKDAITFGVVSIPPRPIHVLRRGEVKAPLQLVGPGAIACVKGLSPSFDRSSGMPEGERRAQLANWLISLDNPLAWRSIANRVWGWHFGKGLVDSPNDFGRLGAAPSHPELLDWLANELLANGQSLKKLHRQIVLSSTYRQSCDHDPTASKLDSSNKFLWRQNRRRMTAEEIRDSILAVTGKLDLRMGGPSYRPFAFEDDHTPRFFYDKADVDDPRTFRRTVYRFVVRSAPDPFFECMDSADPSMSVPIRDETQTPLQALALLHNRFVIRQADHLASRARSSSNDVRNQVRRAAELVWCRPVTDLELNTLTDHFQKRGLENTCRVLLNSSEFLFVD